MTANSTIIERVRRLLALSTSSNVNEAAAAANAAQKLMSKYAIDMLEVEAAQPETRAAVGTEVFEESGKAVMWRNRITHALADANMCVMYTSRGEKTTKVMIVGTAENISVVRYMQQYLTHQVERLWAREARSADDAGRAAGNAFRLGAAVVIADRVRSAKKEIEQETRGTSIVLVQNELARVKAAVGCKLARSRPAHYTGRDAFARGQAAGRTVNLASGPGLGRGSAANLRA